MGRRSEHTREELQQLIIDASVTLVQELGAERVTARKIAEAVGYTPGMLYSVFVNQQDIFLHVNARSLETLYHNCVDASTRSDDPSARIMAMGMAYLSFAETHTHQFDLLFKRNAPSEASTPDVVRNRIQALFDLVEQQLEILAPHRPASDRERGARALWSSVHGVAALALSDQLYLGENTSKQTVIDALLTHFIVGWTS